MPASAPHTHGRTDCCIVGCDRPCVHGVCAHHRRIYALNGGRGRVNPARTPRRCLDYLRARCHMVGSEDDPGGCCWDPDARAINDKGYVWISFFGDRKARGHRVTFRLQSILDGGQWDDLKPWDYVLHSAMCEKRFTTGELRNKCWNPRHLRVGSDAENHADQWRNNLENNPFYRAERPCSTPGCGKRGGPKTGLCKRCYHRLVGRANAPVIKERRDARRAAGLCTSCGGERPDGSAYLLCPACRSRSRVYQRERRWRAGRPA